MRKTVLILLLLASIVGSVQAQSYKLSQEPAGFIADVKIMMAATKNEGAIRIAAGLEEVWKANQLTQSQQEQISGISQLMLSKKLKARPHFEYFFGGLVSAVQRQQLAQAGIDDYLHVVQQSLQNDPLPAFEKFLSNSYSFLNKRVIFQSSYNVWRATGGSFGFAYSAPGAPAPVRPAPAGARKKAADAPAADSLAWLQSSNMPAVSGAVLQLKDITLSLASNGDSLLLNQTHGLLLLTKDWFVGQQALLTWRQPNGEATATFRQFGFDLSKSAFKAENVTLTYPEVLEGPVDGVLEYRSLRNKANAEASFPKFISYTNNARLKNIGERIEYLGGFTLAGSKISTAALDGSPSDIMVSNAEGKPRFKATAANYTLADTLIATELASVLIYQGQDSLTHPGIRLKYAPLRKVLSLTRSDQLQASPFYSSYHQMEISAEMLTWNIEQPTVHFSILNAKNQVPARLTSKEYFTETRYEYLQGTASFHPLIVIASYANKQKVNNFFISELARATKIKEAELAVAAAMLARQNFLTFKSHTGEIILKPKALHYLKSAQGKKDYDYLTLKSLTPSGKNATLDLNKNELLVRGVDRFYFTGDSSAVYAIPDSNQVYIQKNRDIRFNGVVVASFFRFRGSKFHFKYDEFLVDMQKIDTIAFAVKKKKKQGIKGSNTGEQYLSNSISNSSGKLYLNKPDNKSGKKKHKNYPIFDGAGGAYVYFAKPEILGGAYDSTMYFAIPPFKIDSLNANVPGAVGFAGTFYSGGIFPPFETKLTLMDDQSLGFEYQAPKGGLPAYGGKGTFYEKLTMSKKGLQGSGQIKYLAAKLHSNAFTFYRDKVLTLGTKASVAEEVIGNTYFMSANFNKYALEWLPQKDTMHITATSEPIRLYQGKFTFQGISAITPKGVVGDGIVEGADGSIKSAKLAFSKSRFQANNAVFEVKTNTPGKPALRATDVFMEYDLVKGVATFSPERTGVASTDFPYAQFKTSLRGGKWEVSKKRVTMDEPVGDKNAKAYFVSTRPAHENLRFQARSAHYDISNNILNIGGVPYIASADAYIVPDSNKVYIMANSDLKPLKRATVISDTLNKYHQLYQGEIKILSRNKYQGFGVGKYVNASADTFDVKFSKFTMMNTGQPQLAASRKLLARGENKSAGALPADSLQLASAGPLTRKGKHRKASFLTAPQAGQPIPADSTKIEEVMLLADASAVTKPKKAGWRNRRNKAEEVDSTSLALGVDLLEPREKQRLKNGEEAPGSLPPSAAYTEAVATIEESDKFMIVPGVLYKGEITMNSTRQYWDFNGMVKLAFAEEEGASDWFPYKATVNPAEVQFNIQKPVAADGTPLKAGLHLSAVDDHLYNTFVSKKQDETDLDVFEVNGLLSYNRKKQEFRMGTKERLKGLTFEGNMLVHNDSLDITQYEGAFNLVRPAKGLRLKTAGTAIARPAEKVFTLNALLNVEMNVPGAALEYMSKAILENTMGAAEASVDKSKLPARLAQFIGNREANAFAVRSAYSPLGSLSSDLAKGLLFSQVELRWSDSTKAWFSKGKLNVSNILKQDINAQIPGYIEVKRGAQADVISIYLQPLPSLWYYFNFDNNVLLVTSSDEAFNKLIARKRNNSLAMGEAMDKASFVNYFRKNYLKDAPVEEPAPVVEEAPQPASNFEFMEEETGKKKKKKNKNKIAALPEPNADKPEKQEPAREVKERSSEDIALPGMSSGGKKKKKNKKEEESLLPDVDLN